MTHWVLVRPATPADADALVVLGRAVAAEKQRWLTYGRSRSDERRNVRSVRRDADAAVFVAETPAGIVGRLSIARDGNPVSRHVAEFGLMVAAAARRQGIGSALVTEAEKWARGAGITKLELHVFPHNEPALRLYEGFGFEREGYRKGHFLRAGDPVDAILMAIQVTPRLEA